MDFLNHIERGIVFFKFFLLSSLQCTVEIRKRLCEFKEKNNRLREVEEYKSQGKAVEGTVEKQGGKLKTFVWISSKNSASGGSFCSTSLLLL